MNQLIFRLNISILLLSHSVLPVTQVVLGGITQSGFPLQPQWQKNIIGRLLNPHYYSLGLFTLKDTAFVLQSNLFSLPNYFTDSHIPISSTFQVISIGTSLFITLAHDNSLYLLSVKNNRIQEHKRHILSQKRGQEFEDMHIVHTESDSYLFLLNSTSSEVYIFKRFQETLEPEPLSPYHLHEKGINRLLVVTQNKHIYLLVTNFLRNTIRTYLFKDGRLLEHDSSPFTIREEHPSALIPIEHNNKIYICVANKISNTISVYSLSEGRLSEQLNSPISAHGRLPTSMLLVPSDNQLYVLVINYDNISSFTFKDGTLSFIKDFQTSIEFPLPSFNMKIDLIERDDTQYIIAYTPFGSTSSKLFTFDTGTLTLLTTLQTPQLKVTDVKIIQPPGQVFIEQNIQSSLTNVPADISSLIAQFTTLKRDELNYPLHARHLIKTFIKGGSFNLSQALELIKSTRQIDLAPGQSNVFTRLFNDFILPYYIQKYDMTPVKEWLTDVNTRDKNPQNIIEEALKKVNNQLQKTSLFFDPWLRLKLYWLRNQLAQK